MSCRRSGCNSATVWAWLCTSGRSSAASFRWTIRPIIKEGMVFALETYCPAADGYSAARIEEEVVVTDKGHTVISLFPAEELPISAQY